MNAKQTSLFTYMDGRIDFLKSVGRYGTAQTYRNTYEKFRKFTGGDFALSEITQENMERFEAFCRDSGNSRNTISFYMRILRAVFNRAVDEELVEQPKRNPFKKVYTGVDKTVKRAIPIGKVKYIAHMDFSTMTGLTAAQRRNMEYARDMFMFSFYTRGMSFVDMAYLKKSDIRDGNLIYCRNKTGQKLSIRWERCIEDIVRRHPGAENSPYLMDIISDADGNTRRQYKVRLTYVNAWLKEVGRYAGLGDILTMYVARHSWATACKSSNIPISVISEGMGHDSEETTRIYLASLDTNVVDKANRKIINQIL